MASMLYGLAADDPGERHSQAIQRRACLHLEDGQASGASEGRPGGDLAARVGSDDPLTVAMAELEADAGVVGAARLAAAGVSLV